MDEYPQLLFSLNLQHHPPPPPKKKKNNNTYVQYVPINATNLLFSSLSKVHFFIRTTFCEAFKRS